LILGKELKQVTVGLATKRYVRQDMGIDAGYDVVNRGYVVRKRGE
jgi:hypothetical protein